MPYLNKKRPWTGIVPVVLLLGCFVIYPMVRLLLKGMEPGAIFWNRGTGIALKNTLWVSSLTTVLTLTISCILAWLTARTDIPCKTLIQKFSWLTFSVPAYILGIAWVELLGRNGYLYRLLSLNNPNPKWNFPYYSLGSVVAVFTVHLYPLVFMSLLPLFRNQDPTQEQAAALCGMSPLVRFFRITLPLIFPGIAAAGLLVFSRSAANFSVPALLALPVREEVLTSRIFSALSTLDLGNAAFLSFLLVGISGVIFLVQQKATGRKKFSTEKSTHRKELIQLGKMRIPVLILVLLFQFLTSVLPVAVLFISSLLKRWGLPLEGQYFSLQNYQTLLFGNAKTMKALENSLLYGISATLFAGIIAITVSFLSSFHPSRITKIIEGAAGWPLAIPNMVLAVAAVLAWNNPLIPLYGSPWGIIVTYMVLFIPIMLKNISGLMGSFPKDFLHAARLSGASFSRSLRDMLLPLVAPGLEAGSMVCILIALREIPISLMLYSAGQETLGVLLFGMQSQSYGLEMTSALAVFVIVLTLTGQSVGRKIKRSMEKANA